MTPAIRKRGESARPRLRAARDAPEQSGADLDELIEGEIIPRLMMAHTAPEWQGKTSGKTSDKTSAKPSANAKISSFEVENFSVLAVTSGSATMMAEVDLMMARGVCVETIYLDLLAPSARVLGKCWEDDICDFVDVTVGLASLHEVLREVALRSPGMVAQVAGPRTALFSPMPGDQHNFGALMIEEVFNRGGWNSGSLVAPTQKELLDEVAGQALDLLGLTISSDCSSDTIGRLISAVRGVSANPGIQVLIGGSMVNADRGIVDRVGADGTAEDAKSALVVADQLVLETRSLLVSAA